MKKKSNNKAEIQQETSPVVGWVAPEDLYIEGRRIPQNFKVGRNYLTQAHNVEPDLFSKLRASEESQYTISGLTSSVSLLDLSSFRFAAVQILYNQSYLSGHEKNNSGLTETMHTGATEAQLAGHTGAAAYYGDIAASLNDICRYAYGINEPTTKDRDKIKALIDVLHNTPVKIKYPNGDERESYLCVKTDKYYRKADNALFYRLHLCPIFCMGVSTNFAELPQDTMSRLTTAIKARKQRKSVAHIRLLELLAEQRKDRPFCRSVKQLYETLGMWETYKVTPSRAHKQLFAIFQIMVDIGIIESLPIQGVGADGWEEYTFTLSKDFVKRRQQQQALPSELKANKGGRPKKQ